MEVNKNQRIRTINIQEIFMKYQEIFNNKYSYSLVQETVQTVYEVSSNFIV